MFNLMSNFSGSYQNWVRLYFFATWGLAQWVLVHPYNISFYLFCLFIQIFILSLQQKSK